VVIVILLPTQSGNFWIQPRISRAHHIKLVLLALNWASPRSWLQILMRKLVYMTDSFRGLPPKQMLGYYLKIDDDQFAPQLSFTNYSTVW